MTHEIDSFAFTDPEADDAGFVSVHVTPSAVRIVLSLRKDGDIQVFLNPTDAARVAAALGEAIARLDRAAQRCNE